MIFGLLLVAALFPAWSNGANDNFKGVATLYGSGTAGFRGSLLWASLATALGCLVSVSPAADHPAAGLRARQRHLPTARRLIGDRRGLGRARRDISPRGRQPARVRG